MHAREWRSHTLNLRQVRMSSARQGTLERRVSSVLILPPWLLFIAHHDLTLIGYVQSHWGFSMQTTVSICCCHNGMALDITQTNVPQGSSIYTMQQHYYNRIVTLQSQVIDSIATRKWSYVIWMRIGKFNWDTSHWMESHSQWLQLGWCLPEPRALLQCTVLCCNVPPFVAMCHPLLQCATPVAMC